MSEKRSKDRIENLFHDCGSFYVSTIEPAVGEAVTVRLRAEKGNVTYAYVEYSTDGSEWNASAMQKEKDDVTGYYEFFIGTIPGQSNMFKYRFRVGNELPENEVYYSRTYIGKSAPVFDEKTIKTDNCWCMIPGYQSPDWSKGIVWYSVMPDAFYNGDITNDEPISGSNLANPWNRKHHTLQYKYGGDLKGIEKKLDYIKELGAEAVFVDPIFKSSQNAGYGPEDYKQIENSFGNRQALEDLANAVHDRGLRYMQDVVLMFVANGHYWLNKENTAPFPGATQEWKNPYHDFFRFIGEEGDVGSYVSNWGGATLNLANEELKDYLFRDEDSYLQHYCKAPYNIDAIRFDCGGDLSGVMPDGRRVDSIELMGEIRSYLKKVNPDIMLLSEYNMYYGMDSGVWDSRWNLQFVKYALPYMKGDVPESELYQTMDEEMHNLPRAIGLCQYNSMADHDRPRLEGVQPWAYRAYQLIHMTAVGSPCIYYGDENGTLRASYGEHETFYAMEWNESIWDYDKFYQTKALTELRKVYPVLRQGAVKRVCVDDKEHVLSFARMDEESVVITVASRNDRSRSLVIDVRDLGAIDGTVFTDWFTGRRYVAKNGCIGVEVQAGGTILVQGTASTSYKGNFAMSSKENVKTEWMPEQNAFRLEGEKTLLSKDIFNTCVMSAQCHAQDGTGVLYVASEGEYAADGIFAEIQGTDVNVYQQKDGKRQAVAKREIVEGATVLIVRNEDNTYGVYTSDMKNTFSASKIQREKISRLCDCIVERVQAEIPNHAKAGIGVIEGSVLFEHVSTAYEKDTILFSDFRKSHSAMFDWSADADMQYGEEGLTLQTQKEEADMLTNAYNDDWTFKAEISFDGKADGDFAGVTSKQDQNIYVAAGRMLSDGCQKLVFGRASAGKFVVYYEEEDICPDVPVTIQLQRIGTAYTVIYSYDGQTWNMIGRDIIANMCTERAGLMVMGAAKGVYTYASFGNAICDGISYSMPQTPMKIDTDFSAMREVVVQPSYRIVSGDWQYAEEGYAQYSLERTQMGIHNKRYQGLKADGTYLFDEGDGYIGLEFGKQSYDSPLGDGILFRLSSDRTVRVEKQGEILGEAKISEKFGQEIKLAVEYRHGVFVVFAGLEGEPILVIRNMEDVEGYVSYFMEGVKGHINNSLVASYDAKCYFSGQYEMLDFEGTKVTKHWPHTTGFVNPFGVAVTNFEAKAKFRVLAWENEGKVGFAFGAPEGKFEKDASLKVVYGASDEVWLLNGKEIPSVISLGRFAEPSEVHELRVVRKNGMISVYADGEEKPCIHYPDILHNGGTVSLYAEHAAVTFEDFILENLCEGEN